MSRRYPAEWDRLDPVNTAMMSIELALGIHTTSDAWCYWASLAAAGEW